MSLDLVKIIFFQEMYKRLHPTEIQPTHELLKELFDVDGLKVFVSQMNIIAWIEADECNEILAHWCCASSQFPSQSNKVAFFEVLRLVKSIKARTGNEVVIDGLNAKYFKATDVYKGSETKRRFK
jgi:hypothetical protein